MSDSPRDRRTGDGPKTPTAPPPATAVLVKVGFKKPIVVTRFKHRRKS